MQLEESGITLATIPSRTCRENIRFFLGRSLLLVIVTRGLIEMLIVVLIVGILAAVAAPVYFGYTKDAKMSEAKAIAGSIWSSMQGCAQAVPLTACAVSGSYTRAGLTVGGVTADGRWTSAIAGTTLTMNAANQMVASAPLMLEIDGTAADLTNLAIQFSWANATGLGSFQCSIAGPGGPYNPC